MDMLYFVFSSICLINFVFLIQFGKDLFKNRRLLQQESAPASLLCLSAPIIYFFSALGISDFVVSTLWYRRMKLLDDRLLPGTLNTQCVIPVAVMAIAQWLLAGVLLYSGSSLLINTVKTRTNPVIPAPIEG